MMIARERYESGATIEQFIAGAESNQDLWRSVYARASVPEALAERARQLPPRHLLVLAEGWCGDAVNTVPVLARLAEAVPGLDPRILGWDAHPDLMDPHLSDGARAIPVAMVLDRDFRELGWWGSRPEPLQAWLGTGWTGAPATARSGAVARDRGRTTLEEVVGLMGQAALQAA